MRLIITGGSRTLVAAATTSIVTTSRPAATRQLDNLSCRRQHHTCGVMGRRKRASGRDYSTTSVRMSPSPQHHDPNTAFGQGAPPPPPQPPPPISSLSSSYVPGTPKELDGVDLPPPTNASSQLRNSDLPLTPSRDMEQQEQEQEQEQGSASTSESSQISSASDPAVPVTVTAAAGAAEATNNTTTAQPSSSSSTTTSRSLKQIIQASPIGRAANFYSRVQSRRPYWTQLWCTLFIYLCGDLSAQLFVGDGGGKDKDTNKKKVEKEGKGGANDEAGREEGMMARYDPLRTVRHLTVGGLAAVPGYKWFMFLHNNFNFPSKPRLFSIFIKVAINQACFTPIFNTYFFSMQSLLAGTSLTETWERLKLALPISIVNSAKLWPAVTAFMFMYIDPQFRSIFAGAIAVGWQTYLSWLNQKAARDVEAAEEAQAPALAVKRQGGGGVGVGGATATAAVAAVSA